MKSVLDSQAIEIPCSHCAQKISKTIGQLKTLNTITCPRCRGVINVDKAQIAKQVASFERDTKTLVKRAEADLRRKLGRLGKF
jgi:Zn-finger nucleic acid-binding protein